MKYKIIQLLSISILLCMLLIACNKKRITWDDGSAEIGTFQTNHARRIYGSIDEMGQKAWEKETYVTILERIDFYTGEKRIVEADKEKLSKYLDKIYCDILVRDASGIVDEASCETHHSLLNSLFAEIQRMNSIVTTHEELSRIKNRIELHNRIISYPIGNISPTSLMSSYDLTYVDNALIQKSNFEKEDFPCDRVKRRINAIPSELNRRHVNFLNELIELYAAENRYDRNTDNAIRKEIEKYCYNNKGVFSKYGVAVRNATQSMTGWFDKLKEIQQKSETN